MLYAWPGRKHLNDVWNIAADAMEVIEWGSPSGHVEGLHRLRSLDGAEISSSSGSTTTLTERRRMKYDPETILALLNRLQGSRSDRSASTASGSDTTKCADTRLRRQGDLSCRTPSIG